MSTKLNVWSHFARRRLWNGLLQCPLSFLLQSAPSPEKKYPTALPGAAALRLPLKCLTTFASWQQSIIVGNVFGRAISRLEVPDLAGFHVEFQRYHEFATKNVFATWWPLIPYRVFIFVSFGNVKSWHTLHRIRFTWLKVLIRRYKDFPFLADLLSFADFERNSTSSPFFSALLRLQYLSIFTSATVSERWAGYNIYSRWTQNSALNDTTSMFVIENEIRKQFEGKFLLQLCTWIIEVESD